MPAQISGHPERIDWVDYAKGFCIVMVVLMHSTFGVELAAGTRTWVHAVSDFTHPFRMPDFFLISGLFLGRVIDRDWKSFADRRIVHFIYFYVLWLTIQLAFKAPQIAHDHGALEVVRVYLLSFIDPFGTMWFIYLLPIFFAVTKFVRRVPPLAVFTIGVALESLHLDTGWTLIDEFSARFVYFYCGYWLATHFFVLARRAQANPRAGIAGLALWAAFNWAMVWLKLDLVPGISLAMGFLGASAVVTLAALLSKVRLFDLLRYAGEHSLIIYLSFFLPIAATRTLLLKTGVIPDLGAVSLIVTFAAIVTPLILLWMVRGTWASFLFDRPRLFTLGGEARPALAPAE
ncbi:MAG TPA: acyltransferase family protein [Xanthobacteraceae bacterium]|nr:acyltransferase family protein [Xanthobacteraceae bacterium]